MSLLKRIEQFLLTNNVWIFIVFIFLISYAWVMTLVIEGETVIYLSTEKWMLYLTHVKALCILFLPILLFSGFRKGLEARLNSVMYWVLWVYCFVIHPFIIGNWNLHEPFFNPVFHGEILWMYGFVFLILELLMKWGGNLLDRVKIGQWFNKIGLERILLLSMTLFALLLGFLSYPSNVGQALSYALQCMILLLVYYSFYLLNHYFLIKNIFWKKGFLYYGFGFIGLTLIYYPIIVGLVAILPAFQTWIQGVSGSFWLPFDQGRMPFQVIQSSKTWWGLLLSIPFTVVVQWFKQSNKINRLEKEKSAAELNLLKQQINPHFFFNTLNNLYALSLTKDEQTPEVILQLSELMRYVIYKGKETAVPIEEEIKYIEDYIQLQQIRLHKKLDFRFDKTIDDRNLKVPPLLFITLVENAFKHGIEPAEQDCFLQIQLKSDEDSLSFICENSFEERMKNSSGIGLSNLRDRLQLSFPERHDLVIEESQHKYKATLNITFKDKF